MISSYCASRTCKAHNDNLFESNSSFENGRNTKTGFTYETYLNIVFLLQKRVIRAISFEFFTSPSTPIFSKLKILKLYDLFKLKLLVLCTTVLIRFLSCFHFSFALVESVHQYGTRHVSKNDIATLELNVGMTFPIPKAVSDRKLCSFEVRSPKGWTYSTRGMIEIFHMI